MFLIIDTTSDNVIANISENATTTDDGLYSADEDAFYPTDTYSLISVDSVPAGIHTYTHTYDPETKQFARFVSVSQLHDMRVSALNMINDAKKLSDTTTESVLNLQSEVDDLVVAITDVLGGVE